MQLLLTGKKRLPDFTGEWVEKALQDIADNITMGQSPDSFFYNLNMRGLPLIQGNADIAERKTIVRFYSSQITRRGYTGDIIMTVRAPVGSVAKATFDCCLGRGVCAIKGNDFLYHLLVYSEPKWGTLSTGSTFDSISGNELRDVKFLIPVDDKEQATIAAILTDMDKEINDLSAKLLKYRNIKIGMMQTLLTGKIRLTEPDTPAVVIHIPKDEALPKSAEKPHNQQFDDAVAIAAIVDAFYSGKYPLGRKKVQKLLYLLRRRQEVSTAAFKKKAAGPYADEVRYKGGEPIATRNDYITVNKSNQGSMFSKGKIIQKALEYVAKWEMQPDVDWLVAQFLHTPVNQLELLATIDMAMCDLESRGITASVDSVKKLIASDKEWRAKLKKTYFSDDDIGWAITECLGLFNSTGR